MSTTTDLKALAQSLGFTAVAVAPAEPLAEAYREIRKSIRAGRMDGMPWFTLARAERSTHPERLLPHAKSVVILAAPYWNGAPVPPDGDCEPRGRISRYAWGRDYHKVLAKHLRKLRQFLDACEPGSETRAMVDWGPLAEKAYGARAGLGWYGKNTNLLLPGAGSWHFLADLVTTIGLEPDEPVQKTCGSCTRCLPACPTNAFTSPYVLDATRCISYLTIEHRGPIDRELRPLMGDWIFGCDLCQDACPVNKQLMVRGWSEFRANDVEDAVPALIPLLSLSEEEFRKRFQGRAILRAKRGGLVRNVCIALGNIGDRAAIVPLVGALSDYDPLVRGHAAWALGRLGGSYARTRLERAYRFEHDHWVREEIAHALEANDSILRPSLTKRFHREIVTWLEEPPNTRTAADRRAGPAPLPLYAEPPTSDTGPDRDAEFRRELESLHIAPPGNEAAPDTVGLTDEFRRALGGD